MCSVLGQDINSHSASLHQGYNLINGYWRQNAGCNLQWTSIAPTGEVSSNTLAVWDQFGPECSFTKLSTKLLFSTFFLLLGTSKEAAEEAYVKKVEELKKA